MPRYKKGQRVWVEVEVELVSKDEVRVNFRGLHDWVPLECIKSSPPEKAMRRYALPNPPGHKYPLLRGSEGYGPHGPSCLRCGACWNSRLSPCRSLKIGVRKAGGRP